MDKYRNLPDRVGRLILLLTVSSFAYTTQLDTVTANLFKARNGTGDIYIDSTTARTIKLTGCPSGTPGDTGIFLLNGVITRCTKAQFATWVDTVAKAHHALVADSAGKNKEWKTLDGQVMSRNDTGCVGIGFPIEDAKRPIAKLHIIDSTNRYSVHMERPTLALYREFIMASPSPSNAAMLIYESSSANYPVSIYQGGANVFNINPGGGIWSNGNINVSSGHQFQINGFKVTYTDVDAAPAYLLTTAYVPYFSGTTLSNSSIYTNSTNVNIGATDLTYKLNVNGDINIISGSKYKIDGTNLAASDIGAQPLNTNLSSIAALSNAAGWLHNSGAGVFAYTTPTYSDVGAAPALVGTDNYLLKKNGTSTAASIIYDDGTNIGIGTTALYAGSGVRSFTIDAAAYPFLVLKNNGAVSTALCGYSNHTDLSALLGHLTLSTNDTQRVYVSSVGDMAIGKNLTPIANIRLFISEGDAFTNSTTLFGGGSSVLVRSAEPQISLNTDIGSAGTQTGTQTGFGGIGFAYQSAIDYANMRVGTVSYRHLFLRTDDLDRVKIGADGVIEIKGNVHCSTNVSVTGHITARSVSTDTSHAGIGGYTTTGDVNAAHFIGMSTTGGVPGVYGEVVCDGGLGSYNSGVYGYGDDNGAGYGVGVQGNGSEYDFESPNNTYHSGSSVRWKKNIKSIEGALDKILQLNGREYDRDSTKSITISDKKVKIRSGHSLGLIAEEVRSIIPEIVTVDKKDSTYCTGLFYNELTPFLVEAIKELNTKIRNLEQAKKEHPARDIPAAAAAGLLVAGALGGGLLSRLRKKEPK